MSARVTTVWFDEDGEVSSLRLLMDRAEFEYALEVNAPAVLEFPTGCVLTPKNAQEIYHRAGSVPGTHPDYERSSEVFYALTTVVDRLIEYDG